VGPVLLVADARSTPYVPPIWPPTGIGLAVVIIFGYRYWSGILLGESALTASLGIPIEGALGVGVGNTLEVMLGAYLLQRLRACLKSHV
jgi:integral membrane sensor domain MASE1